MMSLIARMRPEPGLRVLVTAGAGGIGKAIAEAFLEAEARVHICDVSQPAIDTFLQAHPDVGASLTDVADEPAVDRLFDEVQSTLGGLEVLINNAGIAGPTGRVDEIDPDEWRRTIDVDLTGQFLVVRRAVPLLRSAGGGLIVNISSVAGRLGYALRTPYSAAKWGVVGLTASLAKELGPEGIRVNAILPGIVRGERMAQVIAARAKSLGVPDSEVERTYLEKVSLRAMVEPDDVAAMALLLAAPAGRNISGQALSVCGNVETL
jgi:NAD(P)-dependent dehydrogenase (short-subunit alcohol dehydrogenase family)